MKRMAPFHLLFKWETHGDNASRSSSSSSNTGSTSSGIATDFITLSIQYYGVGLAGKEFNFQFFVNLSTLYLLRILIAKIPQGMDLMEAIRLRYEYIQSR
ncbi:unnamed protein product [Camellia sinensis]